MPTHNDVETVCTASHITGWDISDLNSEDPKARVNKRLTVVNGLISGGYHRDFKMLFVIVTGEQVSKYGVDEFLKYIGFDQVFDAEYGDKSRHKESGDLHMFCIIPEKYEEGLKKAKEELTKLKDEIDPPKKPDPARQKFPDLLLSHLRKAKLVQDNSSVHNPIKEILLVPADKVHAFLLIQYGIDVKKWKGRGDNWINMTTDILKKEQKAWKAELV
jgi:hypothetical protein